MNWLNPTAAWFLLVIPPVIILYFMKLRREEYRVTAAFLWDRVIREARVDSFFQKLKFNVLLILQILFLLFVVFALMRPFFRSIGVLPKQTVFIIDNSASMGTVENGKIRLDIAREKINEFIDEAASGSSFMLITASDKPETLSGFTTDRARIRDLLSRVRVKDTTSNLTAAVLLAASLLRTNPHAGIVLVGDRAIDENIIKQEEIPRFNYVPVGSNQPNLGIIDFALSRQSSISPPGLFVRVGNFSSKSYQTYLEIYLEKDLAEARQVNLEPGEVQSFVFTVPADFSGIVTARLPVEDSLKADNQAQAVIKKYEKIKVLLITSENPFLERTLAILPDLILSEIVPEEVGDVNPEDYQLVVWDNCRVPDVETGKHVFINCEFKNNSTASKDKFENPYVIDWKKDHPLFRYVDLSDVSISSSQKIDVPEKAQILVESQGPALIYFLKDGRMEGLYITFDLLNSDWPLFPSFPMFFGNAVDFLTGRGGDYGIANYKTGQAVTLDFLEKGEKVRILAPGQVLERSFDTGQKQLTLNLEKVGIYRVKTGKKTHLIPANLLSREESRVTPDSPVKLKTAQIETFKEIPLVKEIWQSLVLVALLILTLEWYIFNRRRV